MEVSDRFMSMGRCIDEVELSSISLNWDCVCIRESNSGLTGWELEI